MCTIDDDGIRRSYSKRSGWMFTKKKSSRELHVVDFENNNKRSPHECVVWMEIYDKKKINKF